MIQLQFFILLNIIFLNDRRLFSVLPSQVNYPAFRIFLFVFYPIVLTVRALQYKRENDLL